MVGSGAKILGPFTVGDNAKIASNAVVLEAIPPNSTAVGVPARVVRVDGKKVDPKDDICDQVHIPDPVSQDMCQLKLQINALKEELLQCEKELQCRSQTEKSEIHSDVGTYNI
jgi:serine O-acetyltransferase